MFAVIATVYVASIMPGCFAGKKYWKMLTDIFKHRYPTLLRVRHEVPAKLYLLLKQSAHIYFEDIAPALDDVEGTCRVAYDKLTRETGHGLVEGNTAAKRCGDALYTRYNLHDNAHGNSNDFVLNRLSLLELMFREAENSIRSKSSDTSTNRQRLDDAVEELNARLRAAGLPFSYHSGFLQRSDDTAIEDRIARPFWNLLSDPKWKNVDVDIKEAMDRRDSRERDSALYALKALESVVKIISDQKGWTTGKEKGAANYIDNLVSSKNGRFIEVWESDQLKSLFRSLRNPHGHGPGSSPQPNLPEYQESWTIESTMIWIKSLISRL